MNKSKITKHIDFILEKFPHTQILGIFGYGSMNYNLITEHSDFDTKVIYVPSIVDIARQKVLSEELHLDNGEHCEVKDIRLMSEMWAKQNINFVEILFTDYKWIHPMYAHLFKRILAQKERIARYDIKKATLSIVGQALSNMKKDNKKYYAQGYRLVHFLEKYHKGLPYKECLWEESFDNPYRDMCLYLKNGGDINQYQIEWLTNKLMEYKNMELPEPHKKEYDDLFVFPIVDILKYRLNL